MLEDIRILIEVQEVDRQIHKIEKDKERLPRLVAIAGEDLRSAEAITEEARAAAESANKSKRDAEMELSTETDRLGKLKDRSSEIKNNKEYFAHLKEIEECQKKITRLEESSLELMERVEKADADLKEKADAFAAETAKFEENKARIEEKFVSGDVQLRELTARRAEIVASVSKEILDYYNYLLKMFPDSAVAEAANGSCTGCRMIIPPQAFNNVRKGEALVKCHNCRRILYFKES
ncbi:MAG: hypothetical protein HZC51_13035 [Nitrospirae bacterium]|nr:hypothetical protein [Nitrospirota bacterium]